MDPLKVCSKCEQAKPLTDFYRASGREGHRSACKACYYQPPSDARRASSAASQRRRRAADPDLFWRKRLRQYGVTPEWYVETLAAQGGGCAICGASECSTGHRFSIDHDHRCCPRETACGDCVRGILCRTCNVGIGNLADSPDRLRAAADYLDRTSS